MTAEMPGADCTVTIDAAAHGGHGVGRIDGKAVFVPGALPGDVVRVALRDDNVIVDLGLGLLHPVERDANVVVPARASQVL